MGFGPHLLGFGGLFCMAWALVFLVYFPSFFHFLSLFFRIFYGRVLACHQEGLLDTLIMRVFGVP